MNKKQIDFDIRVLTLNPGGINGGYRHEQAVQFMHDNYPTELGWEVTSVNHVQLSADGISFAFFLTRWEWFDEAGTYTGPQTAETVAETRKRGRPKKVEAPEGVVEVA